MPERTFPHFSQRPGEIVITPWSSQSLGVELNAVGAVAYASNNYITANLGVFIPFRTPETIVVYKMGWANGTAVAGNIDVGIYDEAGVRLVSSGSTAQSGTTRTQVVNVDDTTLRRGTYYLAISSDTSGATQKVVAILSAAVICQSLGLLQMAAAFALPANAVYAKYASAFVPMIYAQCYRTVGP